MDVYLLNFSQWNLIFFLSINLGTVLMDILKPIMKIPACEK